MTSISAASTSNYLSPLQQLQKELQSEVSAGKISSADQSALSSALTEIDSSLQSGRAGDTTGTRPSPGDLKSKINDLISGEVSGGKLTSDQATELQGLFKAAFANRGPGGPGSAGGPPPSGGDSSSDSTSSSSGTSVADILQQFLKSLQDSLSAASSASSSYSVSGASGSSTSSSGSFSALLINYQA